MAPTPYVKQTWADADPTKPLSAARMGVIETGIFDAHYRPSVSVYRSTVQAIANATTTILLFDAELYDTDAEHSTVSNTGRLTSAVAGKRHITGRCIYVANATGTRTLQLRVNGTTVIDDDTQEGGSASSRSLSVARDYLLAAGDYVEMISAQTSGGSLNTGSGVSLMHFQMHLVSY